MKDKIGNGSMPLRIGNLIDTTVYGGPYCDVPTYYWGVKMAVEIDHPHMVSVPTRDFDVPKVSDLQAGIVKALMAMINEEDVYVGCMGGVGRTGIFLAALAKVQIEYRKSKHRAGRGEDPVLYVRKHFLPHAVETQKQVEYISALDVSDIVTWLDVTQTAMGKGGVTPAREEPAVDMDTVRYRHAQHVKFVAGISEEDNHRAVWKQKYNDPTTEAYYEDTDSADEDTEENAQWLQAESLQTQIDELQEQIDTLSDRHGNLRGELDGRFKAVTAALRILKRLTKQTWYERIRAAFK